VTTLDDQSPDGLVDKPTELLDEIAGSNQSWPVMAAKYCVDNPLPPWKTSLDGLCDALDSASCAVDDTDFTFKDRRVEEAALSATRYQSLPYPENQLVSLAHSLLAHGVIEEAALRQRLADIRARLEAE
jgi:hypothetical protein